MLAVKTILSRVSIRETRLGQMCLRRAVQKTLAWRVGGGMEGVEFQADEAGDCDDANTWEDPEKAP